MNSRTIIMLSILALLAHCSSALASEDLIFQAYSSGASSCRQYTPSDLKLMRESNDPLLLAGAGIISFLKKPASAESKELLELASRIENPKGTATISLLVHQLDLKLPLKPLAQRIDELIHDDRENALPFYFDAISKYEEGKSKEALMQIKNGNVRKLNTYSKSRFEMLLRAGDKAKCSRMQAQRNALWNSLTTSFYIKARYLCKALTKERSKAVAEACFDMGQRLEESSVTLVEKINSFAIQKNALTDLPGKSATLLEIENKRNKALSCGGKYISEADVTEELDLKFDRLFLDLGECAALEFLADSVERKHHNH